MSAKTVVRQAVGILIFIFSAELFCLGQVDQIVNLTSTPIPGAGHDYGGMLNETVNLTNGQISLRIAPPTPPGRRITLPFSFMYESGLYAGGPSGWRNEGWGYMTVGGWGYSIPMLSYGAFVDNGPGGSGCKFNDNFIFYDARGTRHPISGSWVTTGGASGCIPPGNSFTAARAGGTLELNGISNPTAFATFDGTTYHIPFLGSPLVGGGQVIVPDYIEDTNGNQLTITNPQQTANQGGTFSVVDTLGRTLISSSGLGATGNTVSIAGLASPYRFTWTTTNANFSTTWTNIKTDQGNGCRAPTTTVSEPVAAVSAIALPNGRQYSFAYDATYGELNQITYPSGGWVKYQWGLNSQSEVVQTLNGKGQNIGTCEYRYDTPAVMHRFVSFDGTTTALQEDFSYTTNWLNATSDVWTTKQVIKTTHDFIAGQTSQTIYVYTHIGPVLSYIPVEQSITYKSPSGTVLRTVNETWGSQYLLASRSVTLDNGLTSKVVFTYLSPGVLQQKDEYDYGQSTPSRSTVITYQPFGNTPLLTAGPSILDRPSSVIVKDGAGNPIAETDYAYDQSAITSVSAIDHDNTNYPSSVQGLRGNLSTKTEKCFPSCSNSVTAYTYDETGQIVSVTDPNLNVTQFSHVDSFTSGTPPGGTNAYLTKVTRPPTNGVNHIETFAYGYADGQLTQVVDQNNQATIYKYNDPLSRLTETDAADGGITTLAYNDSPPSPTVTTSTLITGTLSRSATAKLDGLAHKVQTQLTTDPEGTDFSDTTYDGVGRTHTQSNPHRSTALITDGTTTYTYDALGRITNVKQPDTSQITTSYIGNTTTVTDEAGKTRTTQVDALGRLTSVTEDPAGLNYVTNYFYDPLDRLTCVEQHGNVSGTGCSSPPSSDATSPWRVRRFSYNSLHLLGTSNPESGAISYIYDGNGNVLSKTAPLPNQTGSSTVVTNYGWDALNRLTQKTYVGLGTAAVRYGYDGVPLSGCTTTPPSLTDPFPAGLRTSMCDGSGATSWSHDKVGRLATENRTIVGTTAVTKSTGYQYNLDGSVTTLTYPSGNVLTYSYSGAGRPTSVIDTTHNINYVTQANYWPHGELSSYIMGATASFAGVTESDSYNNRLQPAVLSAATTAQTIFSQSYGYGTTGQNNGNVAAISNNLDNTRNQSYTYDSLNRVFTGQSQATSGTSCWGQQFGYDAWGNLQSVTGTKTGCTTLQLNASADIHNRLIGFGYDAAGNLTQEGSGSPSWTYTWDAENRLSSISGSASASYTYDGDDRRTKMTNNGLFWRGAGSAFLTKTGLGGAIITDRIYFAGKHIAGWHPSGSVNYFVQEALGGEHTVTDAAGNVCEDIDTLPFGPEIDYTNNCDPSYKFASMERDDQNSANLDYAIDRYYNMRLGRFLTSDWAARPVTVPFARFGDPQTLNLYSYVENEPLNRIDPYGHGDPETKKTQQGNNTAQNNCGYEHDGVPCVPGQNSLLTANQAQNHYQIVVVYDSKTSKGTLYVVDESGKDQRIVLQGGVVVGGNGHVTPTGNFHAGSWEVDHTSKLYGALADKAWSKSFLGLNAFGPYQLHIKELESKGIYIHGTMGPGWSPTTAISGLAVSQTSHGCVRMCNRDDVALHNLMPHPEGTPIKISTSPSDAPEQ